MTGAPNYLKKTLTLGIAAAQIGFMTVAGFMAGLWADKYFKTGPWIALGGLVLGFAAGLRIMILLAKSQNESDSGSSNSSTKP